LDERGEKSLSKSAKGKNPRRGGALNKSGKPRRTVGNP